MGGMAIFYTMILQPMGCIYDFEMGDLKFHGGKIHGW